MTTVTINPTPKTRFQKNEKFINQHRDFLSTEQFVRGVDAAMLQYQAELSTNCKDQYSAMAMGLRLLGAQEFLAKLWELGFIPETQEKKEISRLNHNV